MSPPKVPNPQTGVFVGSRGVGFSRQLELVEITVWGTVLDYWLCKKRKRGLATVLAIPGLAVPTATGAGTLTLGFSSSRTVRSIFFFYTLDCL